MLSIYHLHRAFYILTRHQAIVRPNFKKNASMKIQIMLPEVAKLCDLAKKYAAVADSNVEIGWLSFI